MVLYPSFTSSRLVSGHDLELGRDADTGGQTNYVLELAKALGQHSEVDRLEVITRCVKIAASARNTRSTANH